MVGTLAQAVVRWQLLPGQSRPSLRPMQQAGHTRGAGGAMVQVYVTDTVFVLPGLHQGGNVQAGANVGRRISVCTSARAAEVHSQAHPRHAH